ncbi:PREDICTED: uncharacterized protein LOC105956038 [Erythranthe guttata]|uniref:uncharacterized protein LOC105956038 n=1 Tax=Erythranthe guttata TaxID=4155 RepID=UPI00064D92AE|nr:PREDICTED: uncharacterized protein LOC105956038 [Erythranthe guttata]|eukprot:XP_012835313.1 PREDICTED: uncharacterized protein LOC105956038 [Erythranthe guttata]
MRDYEGFDAEKSICGYDIQSYALLGGEVRRRNATKADGRGETEMSWTSGVVSGVSPLKKLGLFIKPDDFDYIERGPDRVDASDPFLFFSLINPLLFPSHFLYPSDLLFDLVFASTIIVAPPVFVCLRHRQCSFSFATASVRLPSPPPVFVFIRHRQCSFAFATANLNRFRYNYYGSFAFATANLNRFRFRAWKVKNQSISFLYDEAKKLMGSFSKFQIMHVLRDLNSEAS